MARYHTHFSVIVLRTVIEQLRCNNITHRCGYKSTHGLTVGLGNSQS